MEINNVSGYQTAEVKPQKPEAPTQPPGGNIENRQPPSEPSAPTAPSSASSSNSINYNALRTLQMILEEFSDVSNLDDSKQNQLAQELDNSGLLEPGALINMTA